MEHTDKVFPGIVDSSFLEIIAKTPVTQHLKHRVMVGVMTYFFEVIMLSTHAKTLLRVYPAHVFSRVFCTENNVLPLVHSSIGKHQRGIIFNDHRG